MKIILRDDDAPTHGLQHLKETHELLREAGIVHTLALVCRKLSRYKDVIDYIKSDPDYFDPQFHCLDHIDYTKNHDILDEQFSEGLKEFYDVFGKYPDIYYPTWNKADDHTIETAARYGLTTSFEKYSFEQYIRRHDVIEEGVLNFHSWCKEERDMLPEVIEIYKSKLLE